MRFFSLGKNAADPSTAYCLTQSFTASLSAPILLAASPHDSPPVKHAWAIRVRSSTEYFVLDIILPPQKTVLFFSVSCRGSISIPCGASVCRKSRIRGYSVQKLGRVPSSADDGIRFDLKFPGTCASEISLLSPQTCERSECAAADCFPSRKCLHFRESVSRNSTRSEDGPSPSSQSASISSPEGSVPRRAFSPGSPGSGG